MVNVAVVHAVGVNVDGYRETLGIDVVTSEDGAGWTAFLRGLVARGLSEVQLVISDAHAGLEDAIAATLPGTSWQRCRTHFMRNPADQGAPLRPRAGRPAGAHDLRTARRRSAWEQHSRVVEQLSGRFGDAADLLIDAGPDILAFYALPKAHHRQLRSNNPLERLNKEVRRRTTWWGSFPTAPR